MDSLPSGFFTFTFSFIFLFKLIINPITSSNAEVIHYFRKTRMN